MPNWFKIRDIQRVLPNHLEFFWWYLRFVWRISGKMRWFYVMICERPIANHGFCHRSRIRHFSPIGMLCSWTNALYSENKVFLAGSHFSCQASPQSHIGRLLASRSFTFVFTVEYEILLADQKMQGTREGWTMAKDNFRRKENGSSREKERLYLPLARVPLIL